MGSTIRQYLEISPEGARRQWRQIVDRKPRPRQEPFLPVEVVLCFGLFRQVDPHSYGGSNIGQAPTAVHQLAETFKRTPGSILNKMLNLDGSRQHSGRLEPEVFLRLATSPNTFVDLYRVVISAAREVGLSEGRVPDFLGLDESMTDALLGQDELADTEIAQALEEERRAGRLGHLDDEFDLTPKKWTPR